MSVAWSPALKTSMVGPATVLHNCFVCFSLTASVVWYVSWVKELVRAACSPVFVASIHSLSNLPSAISFLTKTSSILYTDSSAHVRSECRYISPTVNSTLHSELPPVCSGVGTSSISMVPLQLSPLLSVVWLRDLGPWNGVCSSSNGYLRSVPWSGQSTHACVNATADGPLPAACVVFCALKG